MGNTLDTIRTGGLNNDLFLSSDSDNRFGTVAQRNYFIAQAFRKLWPQMGRLLTEDVDADSGVMEYPLEAIIDLERILLVNTDGQTKGRLTSWDLLIDESSDPPDLRLTVPQPLNIPITMRCTGYAPYTVPTVGTDTSELAIAFEHIVITGARAEAYRAKLNAFVDYEQAAVENRTTQITAAELLTMYQLATREFEQLRATHARSMRAPKRTRLSLGG